MSKQRYLLVNGRLVKTEEPAPKSDKEILALVQKRHPLLLVSDPSQYKDNPCGPCIACCTIVGVHEIGKLPGLRCEHVCDKGCSIYESRPNSCKNYFCLYQAGMLKGGEKMRPDRFGMIIESRGTEDLPIVFLREVWPNASIQYHVEEFIRGYLRATGGKPMVIVKHGDAAVNKGRLLCDPQYAKAAQEYLLTC